MMTEDDMRAGLRLRVTDAADPTVVDEVTVVGYDPHEKLWVAACPEWLMKISHLDAEDYDSMEVIRD